jgi:exocyst complex component 3
MSAAHAIGEYLQSPDDLAKTAAFRKKLEKEKASIDARLKTGVKEQLDTTREGLRKLFDTRNNVQTIKEELVAVDKECRDPRNAVATFDQICRVSDPIHVGELYYDLALLEVSMVHRNFEQTEEMVLNLLDMNERLDVLEDMLDADGSDILGPAPNLLSLHYQINQLEGFRNQTMHQAKKASTSSRNTLDRWFERLNTLINAFDEYILALARNILPLVRAGNSQVVIKLVKIAEIEGREDEKVIL